MKALIYVNANGEKKEITYDELMESVEPSCKCF